MNYKTLILTILLATGFSIQSCSDDDFGCGSGVYKGFFDIQDLQVKHWDNNRNAIDASNISFEDYGFINLHFIAEYIVQVQNNRRNFSLMNAAYACTPVPNGLEGSKEEAITSLQIITINDFDEDHKAGESINDLLELDFTELEISTELEKNPIPLVEFLDTYTGNVPSEYFMLRLSKEPTLNPEFQVKVSVNLSTGENSEENPGVVQFN